MVKITDDAKHSTYSFLTESDISVNRSRKVLDSLDEALDRISGKIASINNPKKNLGFVFLEYFRLAQKECYEYECGQNLANETLDNFINCTAYATSAFKELYEIGDFYSILNYALMVANASSTHQKYTMGDKDFNLLAKNTEEVTRFCLTIGSEASFAYKQGAGNIVSEYLSTIKSIISNSSVIRHDESLKLAIYVAGRLRFCQHNIEFFKTQAGKIMDVENSFSAIATKDNE